MFATAVRFLAKKGKGKKVNKAANVNIGLEGQQWSGTLREIVKEKGPLTVPSFWEHAQSTGLRSKRHMKMVLKWMRGQNQVKLVCNHIGDRRTALEKEFMYVHVLTRSERLAAEGGEGTTLGEGGEFTTPAEGESVPVASDAPPTPAGATHVEDREPRQI